MNEPTDLYVKVGRIERATENNERAIQEVRAQSNSTIVQVSTDVLEVRAELQTLTLRVTQMQHWGMVAFVVIVLMMGILIGLQIQGERPASTIAHPAPTVTLPWTARLPVSQEHTP